MIGFSVAERELLARIAGVFTVLDPLPAEVRRAAEDAALVLRPTRTWRRLELVRDNVMSARERSLGFGPGGLEVLVRRAGRDAVALRGSVQSCLAGRSAVPGRSSVESCVAPAGGGRSAAPLRAPVKSCARPAAGRDAARDSVESRAAEAAGWGAVPLRGAAERMRRLVDRGAAAVWVRWPGGAERALVGAGGEFDLVEVPRGPVCLAVTGKSAGMALTPWFVC